MDIQYILLQIYKALMQCIDFLFFILVDWFGRFETRMGGEVVIHKVFKSEKVIVKSSSSKYYRKSSILEEF